MEIPHCFECGTEAEYSSKHNAWICPRCFATSKCKAGGLTPVGPVRQPATNENIKIISEVMGRLVARKVARTGDDTSDVRSEAQAWLSAAVGADPAIPYEKWTLRQIDDAVSVLLPYK